MIYVHSIARAARFYPELTALSVGGRRLTFRDLHERVERIAVALHQLGFTAGDRLAILLPNELIYACSRLGIIVVPLNTRFSTLEIDRVLTDASPRGLVRPIQYVTEKGALTRSLAGIKQISEESWKRPVVPAPVNTHQKEHGHE